MTEQTDASMVGAALAGDTGAFCVLVRRYQDYAYGVALGILADFHLALDAAQEAFLCAWCDLPALKDPARFGAWLCGIARNTALEIRRDRQRQDALAKRAAEQAPEPALAPSAGELAAGNEERARVRAALLAVHEPDREALTLYYADGLSYSDICGFLGVSLGTLKGRLQRGRAALRKELAMVEQACKDNAPDEGFARRLEAALRVFSAKGPARDHLPSAWRSAIGEEEHRVLSGGDEGFRINLAMSHAGSRRLRWWAVIHFGLRKDERSLRELERLLGDRSAHIRGGALGWYAGRIRPNRAAPTPSEVATPANQAVPGLEKLLPLMADENFNVRKRAVHSIGAYVSTGDARVIQALQAALADPKHKVRHAAARILAVPCPGCGKTWERKP